MIESIIDIIENPTFIQRRETTCLVQSYLDMNNIKHVLAQSDKPLCFNFPYETYSCKPSVDLDEGSNLAKSPDIVRDLYDTFHYTLDNSSSFFTAGSKFQNSEFVGLSSIQVNGPVINEFRLVGLVSIYTAEATALLETLKIIAAQVDANCTIFSDSRSVLQALANLSSYNTSSIILEIKNHLRILENTGKHVMFYWIPAHRGIKFNEMADDAAKKSIRIGRDSQFEIPTSDFKGMWKQKLRNEFHSWIIESGATKDTFYINNYYKKRPAPWFEDLKIFRRPIVSLIRLGSGHTSLKQSLARFNIIDSSECDCGQSKETPNYVFWQCHKYDDARKVLVEDLSRLKKRPPYIY